MQSAASLCKKTVQNSDYVLLCASTLTPTGLFAYAMLSTLESLDNYICQLLTLAESALAVGCSGNVLFVDVFESA
jgi:hypothetical protein